MPSAVAVLVLAGVASAQPPPAEPEAAEARLPRAFQEQFLTVDPQGRASVGSAHRPLTRLEFFQLAGRQDLAAASQAAARLRLALIVSGAVAVAAGAATAIALVATIPDLTAPPCLDRAYYTAVCQPIEHSHTIGGVVTAIGGAALGALLFTLALWTDPDVLSRDEASAVAAKYNAALKKRLEGPAPAGFLLVPVVGPGGVGLAAQLRF